MRFLCAWALAIPVLVLAGQGAGAGAPAAADAMLERVRSLAAPALAGRGAGSPGGSAAADSVAAWLAAAGLRPAFSEWWFQDFPLDGEGWHGQSLSGLTGANVAGILPGAGRLAGRWIVVGAHYDHLGQAPADTTEAADTGPAYYPGANDNASGVSILVALARRAVAEAAGADRRSLLFASFDGEEVGLQGSAHLVRNPPVPLDSIDVMINLDTVGQLADDRLYVSGTGTASGLADLVRAAGEGLDLSLAEGAWSGSDHMVFNTEEVPVVFVFGGPYPQYNRPEDTWDSLDPVALEKVADFCTRLLASLSVMPGRTEWIMVSRPQPQPGEDTSANRATWLGTLPDFTEEVDGYVLAGVFDGSPAQRAGLQKGDVLVRFGDRRVTDLATFTTALRENDPGALVELVVLRDGTSLKFTVVLGDRADRR